MPGNANRLRIRIASVALAVTLVAGCATGSNPRDPFESFNRGVYSFNENIDRAILKPVAQAYKAVLPQFIRSSVSNFFSNINDVIVALNNLLQGKFTTAYSDLGRIAINSTLGIGGLFDIASEAGIEKHDEDFGQTLGWWGVPDGPFIVLPFFGPSTGRDTVGRVVDAFSDPVTYVDPTRARNQLWGTRVVNRRAELLDASAVLQTAALDPYEFVRDAYLQRRRNLIYDGAAPPDREFLDPPAKPKGAAPRQIGPVTVAEASGAWTVVAPTVNTAPAPQPRPSTFPSAGETVGAGSVLVSGEALTPVASTHSQPAPAAVPRLPSLAQLWQALTRQ